MMAELDTIKFHKLSLTGFTEQDRNDFTAELKRRKIRYRLTTPAVLFDDRYINQVRDLIPHKLR